MENLMDAAQAAQYLGVTIHAIRRWTSEKRIPYIKLASGSLVRYRQQDLDDFVLAGRVTPGQLSQDEGGK